MASARNKQALDRLPGEPITSIGTLTGDTKGFEAPTDKELTYKVGAQVMLLINDPSEQFVNGSLGTIEGTGVDEHRQPWVRVRLQDDSRATVGPHTWDITQPVVEGGRLTQEVVGTFTQLPFRLAWAITIHKSQGQTVDRLIVDLTGGTFAYGQLYVALSRCTSMQGLVLKRPVNTKDLKTDQRVRRFLNSSTGADAPHVYLGMCWAGHEGRMTRPRPVEIALVRDDGTELTTLVNPESDLYDSRTAYGIGAAHVISAPRLREAWPALQTAMAGHVPVGARIDESLGWIDFELKRNGVVMPVPLGVGLDETRATPEIRAGLRASTALERARATRDLALLCDLADSTGESFDEPTVGGYLLPREVPVEHCMCFGDDDWVSVAMSRQPVVDSAVSDVAALLTPGTRVCFTGSVVDDDGRSIDRDEMEQRAIRLGLKPVGNVSKTRCDVLVVAELGTQSGKARKAAEFGKPVIEASAFLQFAGR